MKKLLMILLSVIILSVAGCNTTKDVADVDNSGYEETIETEETTEEEADSDMVVFGDEDKETEPSETPAPTDEQEEEVEPSEASEEEAEPTTGSTEEVTPTPTEEPKPTPEPTEEPIPEPTPVPTEESTPEPTPEPESTFVAYDPNSVVSLAIAKCQAGGMITTQDNLANALAEGRITQAEYDEYYPYDGLESSYYSVFIETDLSKASTISGQPLTSEDAIATHIANMLLLENGKVFNIIYAGVYSSGGTDFYEFRCLR
ncbi:MAG: hypothetical protein IJX63_12210 [Lachnospiraceae bacterium]|nr:hypothetical protein [Lachnospiraceae bacterium]